EAEGGGSPRAGTSIGGHATARAVVVWVPAGRRAARPVRSWMLAYRGAHRAPSIPDLLIAATAEKAGLTVLAADKDFTLIAAITGQPIETRLNGTGAARLTARLQRREPRHPVGCQIRRT